MEAANCNCEIARNEFVLLPVKRVQVLADGDLSSDVLERYERPEIRDYPVHHISNEIPVVDFSRLLDPDHSKDEIARLHSACEEWGFFKLVGNGIPDEVIETMKVAIQEFFRLPLKEKEVFAQRPGDMEGYGQLFVVSDDQKLDWADMFFLRTQPLASRNMNFWPTRPSAFREALDRYTVELKEIARHLFELIAKNLGAEPKKFADMFGEQSVRINYYPPCPVADKVLGLSPHSDVGGLTLLLQINEVQGLQIKKDGAWIPVIPLPGALVVNIGDTLEVLSNGKYKSIEHRVVINPKKERLSIATFHNLMKDSAVGPLPEIVKGSEEKYKTMSSTDFKKLFFYSKLDGKSLIDFVKLEVKLNFFTRVWYPVATKLERVS